MSFIDDLQTFKSQFSGKQSQDIQDTQLPAFIDDLENYSKKQLPSVSRALEPLTDMISPKQEPEIKSQEIINQELQPTEPMPSGQMAQGMPRITQKFGNMSAVEVFSGGFNRGTDFGVGENTQISVPQGDWQVVETFDQATKRGRIGDKTNRGYGNSVLVRNKQTGETLRFSHLNKVGVRPGQTIKGGTIVGLSGATGNVTGAHVDVEYTDPKGKLTAVERSPYAQDIFGGRGGGNPIINSILGLIPNVGNVANAFKAYQNLPEQVKNVGAGVATPIETSLAGVIQNEGNIKDRITKAFTNRQDLITALQSKNVPFAFPIGLAASIAIPGAGELASIRKANKSAGLVEDFSKMKPSEKASAIIEDFAISDFSDDLELRQASLGEGMKLLKSEIQEQLTPNEILKYVDDAGNIKIKYLDKVIEKVTTRLNDMDEVSDLANSKLLSKARKSVVDNNLLSEASKYGSVEEFGIKTKTGNYITYNPKDVFESKLFKDFTPSQSDSHYLETVSQQAFPADQSISYTKMMPIDLLDNASTNTKGFTGNQETIKSMVKTLKDGGELPPIIIENTPYTKVGEKLRFGIFDGATRLEAYKKAGIKEVKVAVVTNAEDFSNPQLTDIYNQAKKLSKIKRK